MLRIGAAAIFAHASRSAAVASSILSARSAGSLADVVVSHHATIRCPIVSGSVRAVLSRMSGLSCSSSNDTLKQR